MNKKIAAGKGNAKDIVTDFTIKKDIAEKAKTLLQYGFTEEQLKKITQEEFYKLYNEFNELSTKYDDNLRTFMEEIKPVLDKWSFEEVFVFTIDVLNSALLKIARDEVPAEEKELINIEDFFPVLYDSIYEKCIFNISQRYLSEKK
jgi:transcription termination factor NusB